MKNKIERAQEMLRIAAEYIRDFCPDELVHYDDSNCDVYCIADDCETAAEMLENEAK